MALLLFESRWEQFRRSRTSWNAGVRIVHSHFNIDATQRHDYRYVKQRIE
jgi:hypothetical protein